MKIFAKAALGASMLAGAVLATVPASASVGIEFGFGGPGFAFGDPCAYYDYYDEPPPWGLPPDYCDYPVYFEPVFFDGYWYRGPIYYRWTHGRRLFWLHGGWHEDAWRGPRPPSIDWRTRGGINHGFRPGMNVRGGFRGRFGPHPLTGIRPGGGNPWGGGHDSPGEIGGSHFGGGSPWSGGRGGGQFGGGHGGSRGGHGPH
jgi:hypothetical protein